MIPLYKNGKKIHMTHLSAVVAFFTLRANLCRKQTSLPWQGCWKNTLHCKLLNFTTKLQLSNLKSNVKSTKRITSSVFTLLKNSEQ